MEPSELRSNKAGMLVLENVREELQRKTETVLCQARMLRIWLQREKRECYVCELKLKRETGSGDLEAAARLLSHHDSQHSLWR